MRAVVHSLLNSAVIGFTVLAQPLGAQEITYPDSFSEPMPLVSEALGDLHVEITTDNDEAQAFFDQGFQLMYAFAKLEAARSFRQSQIADPDCAICYWGEAWAWGSYLNGAMTTAEGPRAWHALQEAVERIDNASVKEADMIRALQARYVEHYDPEQRRAQDEAYADAMAQLSAKYPDDLNLTTLYADALFLLEERRGYRDINNPRVHKLHSVLLSVLDRDIRHPGACHLLVHATESTTTPELAAPCARFLGSSIPGASHINHMPSHTWNEMGLWHDAVRSNTLAWHSDQKAAFDRGFSIYPTHNLTMLYYAASMGGESAAAIRAATDLAKISRNTAMLTMALVRFGKFDEVLAVEEEPSGEINKSMYDFSLGYAALKTDDMDSARRKATELNALAETTTASFRFHEGKDIVGTLAGILDGEIAWTEGNMEAAAEAFRRAVDFYDNLNYDEPEPLPFSPRHWLGAAYMELGAYDNAEQQFRTDLAEHPHNIWGLYGVQQALKAKGQSDAVIDQDLYEALNYADIWMSGTKH